MLRKSRKQLTIRFLHRTVLFLTTFSAGLALFFWFGNVQSFLDSTQKVILSALSVTSLLSLILSAVLFVIELVLLIRKRSIYIPLMAGSFFCFLFCAVLAVLSRTIMLLSRGF